MIGFTSTSFVKSMLNLVVICGGWTLDQKSPKRLCLLASMCATKVSSQLLDSVQLTMNTCANTTHRLVLKDRKVKKLFLLRCYKSISRTPSWLSVITIMVLCRITFSSTETVLETQWDNKLSSTSLSSSTRLLPKNTHLLVTRKKRKRMIKLKLRCPRLPWSLSTRESARDSSKWVVVRKVDMEMLWLLILPKVLMLTMASLSNLRLLTEHLISSWSHIPLLKVLWSQHISMWLKTLPRFQRMPS